MTQARDVRLVPELSGWGWRQAKGGGVRIWTRTCTSAAEIFKIVPASQRGDLRLWAHRGCKRKLLGRASARRVNQVARAMPLGSRSFYSLVLSHVHPGTSTTTALCVSVTVSVVAK